MMRFLTTKHASNLRTLSWSIKPKSETYINYNKSNFLLRKISLCSLQL